MQSPSEYYRESHPDEFSDSKSAEVTEIDREVIDHALASITTNNQEQSFERFCIRVCEVRVCPNLIPNTGPAGGGDGKVDADTFPVADSLSFFEGVGKQATDERWAIAISAKKNWKQKLDGDVKSILSTGRSYARVIFVTNQAVPSKERQKAQDELEYLHKLPVTILDRTWLIDSITFHNCAQIAVDELGFNSVKKFNILPGPRDEKRRKRLTDLISELKNGSKDKPNFLSVENALLAAQLARSLEEPQGVVDTLFNQARDYATKLGTDAQRIEVEYQLAWTQFWWYEDCAGFLSSYKNFIESLGNEPSFDGLSKWRNLWNIAPVALEGTKRSSRDRKTKELRAAVKARIAGLVPGSTSELNTRFLNLELSVYLSLGKKKIPSAIFATMAEALPVASNHLGFDFESFIRWIEVIAELVPADSHFESLYDLASDLQASRGGEVSAAKMQLDRAEGLINSGSPREAIARLSRADAHLLKHETRSECLQCLFLLGSMYLRLGLTWVARATFITASAIGLQTLVADDELHPALRICLTHLRVLSVASGLLGESLMWQQLALIIHSVTYQRTGDDRIIPEEETNFEILLSRLILRIPNESRMGLGSLPAVLDQLDLPIAADFARIKLGGELSILDYMPKPPKGLAVDAIFHMQADMSLADEPIDVPSEPRLLETSLFGCRFEFEFENSESSRYLAEVLLALIEPIFATATVGDVFAFQERVVVRLAAADSAGANIELERLQADSHADFCISHGSGVARALCDAPETISLKLVECALQIGFSSFMSEAVLKKTESQADAGLFERCHSISRCISDLKYVVGDMESLKLQSRLVTSSESYPISSVKWNPAPKEPGQPKMKAEKPKGPLSEEVFRKSLASLNHSEISVVSPIRSALWDAAGWFGVMFAWSPYEQAPPVIALGFDNSEVGQAIIEGWKETYGEKLADNLRISIIRGISKSNPYHYRLLVTGQVPTHPSDHVRFFQSTARVHTMQATTPQNLQGFLDIFAFQGRYILSSTGREIETPEAWNEVLAKGILLRKLVVRQAWEIGRHDPDIAGVLPDDDVILPDDVENPPVLELLKWKRERPKG
jgi:hypothetical protein